MYSGCTTYLYSGFSSENAIYSLSNYSPSYTNCTQCITANPCLPNPSPTPTSTSAPAVSMSNTPTKTSTPTPTHTQTPQSTTAPIVSPTNTRTQSQTPTNTRTISLTPSQTKTSTQTPTPTNTQTQTPTFTQTSTNTPTNSLTPSNTLTSSITPTNTLTSTNTPTKTSTPTNTLTNTPTRTVTKTPLVSFSNTPVYSPTPTHTPNVTPTLTSGFGCLVNSYCLFTNFSGYSQYDGTYFNYGTFNGYTLFYSNNPTYPAYIYFNQIDQRWVLSESYGGDAILFGPTGTISNCPDLNSSIFGTECPVVTPSSSANCDTFIFSASFGCDVIVPETPTPTTTLTQTMTQTMTPTQICYGKSVSVIGQYVSNNDGNLRTFGVTPSPVRECAVTSEKIFLSFESQFYSSYSKLLIDCSNSNNYLISEVLPFNTGATFQAIIDGQPVCVTYDSDVLTAPLNVLDSIESGNLYDCRWCSVAVTPTNTQTMTLTPTITKTQTKTPTLTQCLNTDIDFEFITGQGISGGYVYDTFVLNDGRIIIGGDFTSYRNNSVNRLCILNTNGSIDTSFSTNIPFIGSKILTISVDQTNQKIYVATETGNIYKLNYSGQVDNLFFSNVGTSFNNKVNKIQVVNISNNYCDIICIGEFTQFNGSPNGYIEVLNSNGAISSNYQQLDEFNGPCYDMVYDRLGKTTIVGDFTEYDSSEFNRIVRIDGFGNIDFTLPKSGFTNTVKKILISNRFEYVCAGDFTSYSGVSSNEIIRLNYLGQIINTFNFDSNNGINTIDFDVNQTQIFVGGNFENSPISNLGYNNLISLSLSGSINNNFGSRPGFNGEIDKIKVDSSNRILCFGNYTSYNLFSGFNRIIRLYPCQVGIPATPTMTVTPTTINCINIKNTFVSGYTFLDFAVDIDNNLEYLLVEEVLSNYNYILKLDSDLNYVGIINIEDLFFDIEIDKIYYHNGRLYLYSIGGPSYIYNISTQSVEEFLYSIRKISSVDSDTLCILSPGGSIIFYETVTGIVSYSYNLDFDAQNLVFNSSNNKVYVTYPSQNKIYSLDVDTSVLNETVVGENPLGMSINTDNNTLYVCNNVSNSISIIECDFDSVINTISGIDGPTDVIFNQNENKIYVSQEFSQQVSIINCESLVKLCTSTFYYNISKILLNTNNLNFFVVDLISNIMLNFGQYIPVTPSPTPSSPTQTPTLTPTVTPTITDTPTQTPTNTGTPTVTPTNTGTPTVTPTNTRTQTNTPTNTRTQTNTPTNTQTNTPTNTQTQTQTKTQTPTITNSPSTTPLPAGTISPYVFPDTYFNSTTELYSIVESPLNDDTYLITGGFSFSISAVSSVNAFIGSTSRPIQSISSASSISNYYISKARLFTGNTSVIVGNFTSFSSSTNDLITIINGPNAWQPVTYFTSPFVQSTTTRYITDVAVTSDNGILLSLNYTPVAGSGSQYNQIRKLTSTGSNFAGFTNTGTTETINSATLGKIKKFALSTNQSQIVLVGNFSSYTDSTVSTSYGIAAITSGGTVDTTFTAGTGFNSGATDVISISTGGYMIGGQFTSYSGVPVNYITKINNNGTIDNTFSARTFSGLTRIDRMKELSSGKIAVFGNFSGYDGYTARDFIILNTDGSLDTSVTYLTTGFEPDSGSVGEIRDIVENPSSLIVVGYFNAVNSLTRYSICEIII